MSTILVYKNKNNKTPINKISEDFAITTIRLFCHYEKKIITHYVNERIKNTTSLDLLKFISTYDLMNKDDRKVVTNSSGCTINMISTHITTIKDNLVNIIYSHVIAKINELYSHKLTFDLNFQDIYDKYDLNATAYIYKFFYKNNFFTFRQVN